MVVVRDTNEGQKLTPEERKLIWSCCSGAKNMIETNPGYYEALKNNKILYPHPGHGDVEKDLKRSGLGSQEGKADQITMMRNILGAFISRNPTVGYCQGMNFITARLLVFLNEEEAFWTLTAMIEQILPIDNYSNLVGVLVDQKILQELMEKRVPYLWNHLKQWQET